MAIRQLSIEDNRKYRSAKRWYKFAVVVTIVFFVGAMIYSYQGVQLGDLDQRLVGAAWATGSLFYGCFHILRNRHRIRIYESWENNTKM